jgi:hypothetical protein
VLKVSGLPSSGTMYLAHIHPGTCTEEEGGGEHCHSHHEHDRGSQRHARGPALRHSQAHQRPRTRLRGTAAGELRQPQRTGIAKRRGELFSRVLGRHVPRSSAKGVKWSELLARPFHMHLFFDARLLGAVAAHVLALFVVVAQPVASLAWLGGAHATLEQAALHEAAVANGHNHHHGTLERHEHPPVERDDKTDVHISRSTLGPEFASAAPYTGPFQGLLQILLQAMLAVLPDAPSPGEQPRRASPAEDVSSQHSPSVPHKPPILLSLTSV